LKTLFAVVLLILAVVSAATYLSLPGQKGDDPVLTWVVTSDPIRLSQVELFKEWLEENGYPSIDLRIDTVARSKEAEKNVIQGVAGVAGDLLNCGSGQVGLYESVGMLADLTDVAQEMGFDESVTYPSVRPLLKVNGRQYGFPRNVGVRMSFVNVEAFERVGLSVPPDIWTFDEFERRGMAYIQASNVPGEHQTVYFTSSLAYIDRIMYARSMGGDWYNETMTRSGLDNPIFEEVYEMIYRWINELRIVPTLAARQALSSDTGSGVTRADMHLFSKGNLGLITAGRWAVMHFRLVGPYKLSVCEIPYKEFRNTLMMSGVGAVYEGSKHKELAYYFMKFYASEKYNRQIIENGDGLPPVPRFTKTEAFSRPPKHPNEWGVHDRILKMATEIAIPISSSPYVLDSYSRRQEDSSFDKAIAGRSSVKEALKLAARVVNEDIKRKVGESPELRLIYEQGIDDQKKIERLRKEGKPVPLELIPNPFYRRYYVEKGWSLTEGG